MHPRYKPSLRHAHVNVGNVRHEPEAVWLADQGAKYQVRRFLWFRWLDMFTCPTKRNRAKSNEEQDLIPAVF